ncbi:MAG: hypothetical protein Q8P95_04880 [bacterium]|nr:hypothetical protein [bacterium]
MAETATETPGYVRAGEHITIEQAETLLDGTRLPNGVVIQPGGKFGDTLQAYATDAAGIIGHLATAQDIVDWWNEQVNGQVDADENITLEQAERMKLWYRFPDGTPVPLVLSSGAWGIRPAGSFDPEGDQDDGQIQLALDGYLCRELALRRAATAQEVMDWWNKKAEAVRQAAAEEAERAGRRLGLHGETRSKVGLPASPQ